MREAMKKTIILIVLAIAVPACLFADRWFTLSLNYDVTRNCSVRFWQPGTTSEFDNSTIDVSSHVGETRFLFSVLGLSFTGTTIISLELGWTPFYKTTTVNDSYELDIDSTIAYDLGVETKGDSSRYCWSTSEKITEDGFENGFQISLSRKKLVEQVNPSLLGVSTNEDGKNAIADLYVNNMNVESGLIGKYTSFLICYITVD